MKKIVIMINDLDIGGAQRALINLLEEIDPKRVKIELLLFKGGELEQLIPDWVLVKHLANYYLILKNKYHNNIKKDLLKAVAHLDLKYFFEKIKMISRYRKNKSLHEEQRIWCAVKDKIDNIHIDCDICLSYMQGTVTYYLVDKVITSGEKFAMFNTDYIRAGYDKEFDRKYFEALSKIACVSEEGTKILKKEFPVIADKIIYTNDVMSSKQIIRLAESPISIQISKKTINIVTCGRLDIYVKGLDMVMDVAEKLKESGCDFCWYIVGGGEGFDKLDLLRKNKGLEKYVVLTGMVTNPYPIMKSADFIVIASRFEGKSLIIKESKALRKPLISTCNDSIYSEITDGYDGYITDISTESIYERVKQLIDNSNEIDRLANNIKVSEETGVEHYYKMFEV